MGLAENRPWKTFSDELVSIKITLETLSTSDESDKTKKVSITPQIALSNILTYSSWLNKPILSTVWRSHLKWYLDFLDLRVFWNDNNVTCLRSWIHWKLESTNRHLALPCTKHDSKKEVFNFLNVWCFRWNHLSSEPNCFTH